MKAESLLYIVKNIVRDAARILINGQENLNKIEVNLKGINDYISNINLEVETFIIESLRKKRPSDCFITENTYNHLEHSKNNNEVIWIIEPLSGTRNFIMGNAHFAISIAAMVKGQITIALVYNPMSDEMFTAVKGKGAYFNEHRIRVNKSQGLENKIVNTGLSYKQPDLIPHQLNVMNQLLTVNGVADFRMSGSPALDLCYVAVNRSDAYYEKNINIWNIAAGQLIVKESGGFIVDTKGTEDYINENNYLQIHEVIAGYVLNVKSIVLAMHNIK